VTFSFIERAAALAFANEADLVAIANPLSETFAVLRPSLVPGLVDAASHNRRHGRRDIRLFELGARFLRGAGESRTLAFVWSGAGSNEHWSGTGRPVDFFDAKGVVEGLARHLSVACRFDPLEAPWLVPGRGALVSIEGDPLRPIGFVGQLAPALATARDMPSGDPVFVGEVDLDGLPTALDRLAGVAPLPRFPSVVRDLAIVVPEHLPAATIRGTIRRAAPTTLVDVHEFDRYQGKALPAGTVSLAVHLTFQASDRTLTDIEVQQAIDGILTALAAEHGATLRS
jgi:phenylalanyl-tRNA synthetase beta chain